MARELHNISILGGSQLAFEDRLHVGVLQVPYGAGTGNGAAVAVAFSGSIPPNALIVPASTPAGSVAISNQSVTGFTVTVTPPTGQTLAAGSAGILVIA